MTTSKRIIAVKRYKNKQITKQNKATSVDLVVIENSEQKVARPIQYINHHIIRKEFKQNSIKKYNFKGKFTYFLPDSKGRFNRVTLAGNVFSCTTSKQFKIDFKKIGDSDSAYRFINRPFEHLFPDKWLEAMDVSGLPRSGVRDPAIGRPINE